MMITCPACPASKQPASILHQMTGEGAPAKQETHLALSSCCAPDPLTNPQWPVDHLCTTTTIEVSKHQRE